MISKAYCRPHTIFLSLPVKDYLYIDIVEIIVLKKIVLVKKNNLPKQFTRLVEIRFYVTYFPESVSSIQSRQKNVLS